MKRQFYILLIISFFSLGVFYFSANKDNSNLEATHSSIAFISDTFKLKTKYLELNGKVNYFKQNKKNTTAPLEKAIISVYKNEILFAQYYTNSKGNATFRLPLGDYYKVVMSKEKYVSKFIEVDTKMKKTKTTEFNFPFEINLFKEEPNLDISILEKPIAVLKYNALSNQFEHDPSYTNSIRKDLIKLTESYYYLQKIDKEIEADNDTLKIK